MATLMIMTGGALINTLAFSGINYLFSKLSGHGEAERKRHDEAVEKLNTAQAQWVRDRQAKLDWFGKQREVKRQAGESLKELDDDLYQYYIASEKKTPQLKNLYTPSKIQQDGELTFIVASLTLLGVVVYKYL